MKKIISVFIIAIMLLSSVSVSADSPINLYLDGKKLDSEVSPVIYEGRTMVPFRVIFEALGADVTWSDALKKVYATLADKTIVLTIGSDNMYTDDDIIKLDAAPFIQDGKTMIPVRAVCEIFGCTVNWHEESRSVIIRTQSYQGPAVPEDITNPKAEVSTPQYQEIIVDDNAYYEKDNNQLIETAILLINDYRAQAGLIPLEYSEELEAVAYGHSKDMAENDYLSHTSPYGVTFIQRIDNAGIVYSSAAENIASGFPLAEKAVESWMNSESHRANILNSNFTKVGLGYFAGGTNGTYWTLLLIAG